MFLALLVAVTLLVCGVATAQEPSAKFSAVWSSSPLVATSYAEACDGASDVDFDWKTGALLATMKMPSGKEILAGVSAESGILLFTKVTGKLGGSGTAIALGRVAVVIKACDVDTDVCFDPVPNGRIVLNARVQALTATLGGVIDSCTDIDGNGTIDVETECIVTDEEIGLLTKNQSANHFNVVFLDLPQGTYQIRARFTIISASYADSTENACAYAGSRVVLGDRIVTLQDVRAVKGLEPVEIP